MFMEFHEEIVEHVCNVVAVHLYCHGFEDFYGGWGVVVADFEDSLEQRGLKLDVGERVPELVLELFALVGVGFCYGYILFLFEFFN